jgi:hypothetical protein
MFRVAGADQGLTSYRGSAAIRLSAAGYERPCCELFDCRRFRVARLLLFHLHGLPEAASCAAGHGYAGGR